MKKPSMRFYARFIVLSGFLATLGLARATDQDSSFDPSGHWSIHFDDRCSGSSTVRSSLKPTTADKDFQCSSYLEKDKPPLHAELNVQYNPETNTVTLTGGPSRLPREIPLDRERTGVSNVKLFPKTTTESKGCDLYTYFLEGVRFKDPKTMEYRYITVNEFVPHVGAPEGCKPYLSDLKTAVQRRTATGLLLAMRDIDAIHVKSMQDLSLIELISGYTGTKRTS